MAQPIDDVNPRKRGSDYVSSPEEDDSAKRACVDAPPSPHLKLLEELYDLEAEDDESGTEAPLTPCNKEVLVAEMMKSLEKVIGNGEDGRNEGETSTSSPNHLLYDLDVEWGNEEIAELSESSANGAVFEGEARVEEGDLQENAEIKEMLQVSDDVLGVPLSSADMDDVSFREEWALLASEISSDGNMGFYDPSLQLLDEALSLPEPLLLF